MVRLGINGLGRIGRAMMRLAATSDDLEVVAANELAEPAQVARLLAHDTTFGRFPDQISLYDGLLVMGDRKTTITSMADIADLRWGDRGVDVVLECTGRFRTRETAAQHLDAGARKVLVSAPAKDVDATIVVGVNDDIYDPDAHHVISNASCTTNCVAPMVKVLDEAFGLDQGFMTTIHAYTNDQNLVDGYHKDPRRARSAAANIIPTSTGAARAVGEVLPALAGRLDGIALRVPVVDGSLVDLAAILSRPVTASEVNAAFEAAADHGPLAGRLQWGDASLVSSDVIGTSASCIFDAELTQAQGSMVKVFGWYDNEWGYTARLADLARLVAADHQ